MANKLLACPFCGEEAIMYTRRQVGYPSGDKGYETCISCWHEGCGGRVVSWALREDWAKESATLAWNTRTTPTPVALSIEQLRRMNGEPVWVVPKKIYYALAGEDLLAPKFALVDKNLCYTKSYSYYFDIYGRAWLAYATKPSKQEKDE